MFTKVFTLAILATLTVAAPAPWDSGSGGGSTTSTPQCCQQVENSSDPGVADLVKSLIGVDVSGLNIPIGTGCAPVAVLGGVACNQNPVTCGTVYSAALVGINCVPVIVNA